MTHRTVIRSNARLKIAAAAGVALLSTTGAIHAQAFRVPVSRNPLVTRDASGLLQTSTPAGHIDKGNPFFQSLCAYRRLSSEQSMRSSGVISLQSGQAGPSPQ